MGVNAQMVHTGPAEVHAGGKQAGHRPVAGHPVDGAVGGVRAPGPLDLPVVGLLPQLEDKGPVDGPVRRPDVQLPLADVLLQILGQGIAVAPLGGVSVFGHEAAGGRVDRA